MSLKRPNILWPALAGITLALAGLGGCAQSPPGEPAVAASDAPAAASGTLKLERVVMLMRHGVRPPTRPVANWSRLVLPISTAPAAISRSTTGAVAAAL